MGQKEEKTNVMRILERNKLPYTPRFYQGIGGPEGDREYGLHVARTLGLDPERVFKTLVARGAGGGIFVYVIPVGRTLDLKKAARVVGEKWVELLPVAQIASLTGYVRGGCSPVGMKKRYPTVFHETAGEFDSIVLSAGKIGAQVEVAPQGLLALLGAGTADLVGQ